jgi:hypothetical protein
MTWKGDLVRAWNNRPMTGPLCGFELVPHALSPDLLAPIAESLRRYHYTHPSRRPGGQTGINLKDWEALLRPALDPLDKCIAVFLKRLRPHPAKVRLHYDRSSCRLQMPSGDGALSLHQDVAALGVNAALGAVAWVPLSKIDDDTPTLEVSVVDPGKFSPHHQDGLGYSVLPAPGDWPLMAISNMHIGDVLLMAPRTMHRTSVKKHHSKERLSLDLRFVP